ncbi:MAG: hypothetical protein HN646_02325 [Nitrospina sp.]|jgi:hypothetical protein|nr:hypothetical protein [Nitrospina sp.]MBT7521089.1 hypothetical protein [Nitrospina sp.]MDG1843890.1 hypothetical protein [Nitrospinaceae bacterium]|tara:strand:- start:501 stop:1070 length:570 start_codon:yes stop_codon:yes gene_type:complete
MFANVIFYMVLGTFSFALEPMVTQAETKCPSLETKKIKVEGYISKKFKKDRKKIAKEFIKMGDTRTALKVFPMGKASDVVAVGRCVPAYIARHVLSTAIKYTGGVGSLVVQDFVYGHWIGIGTTMFDEPSQRKVTTEQVSQLLKPDLDDKNFHLLYRKFSKQNELVPLFGLKLPNSKISGNTNNTLIKP